MTQTTQDAYSAADLETNRTGRLTDDQRRYLKAAPRPSIAPRTRPHCAGRGQP